MGNILLPGQVEKTSITASLERGGEANLDISTENVPTEQEQLKLCIALVNACARRSTLGYEAFIDRVCGWAKVVKPE